MRADIICICEFVRDFFADKRLKMQNSELEDDKTPWGQALDMPYIVKIDVILLGL